jgi:hypothetical protein
MDEPTPKLVKQEGCKPLRDEHGRLLPGYTANPNGAPRKEERFSEAARRMLAAREVDITYSFPKDGQLITKKLHIQSDKTINDSLVAALVKEGMDGNVQAIKELVDRIEGKARESIDHTTKGEKIQQTNYTILDQVWEKKIDALHDKVARGS